MAYDKWYLVPTNRVTFKESAHWSGSLCLASKPVLFPTVRSDVPCHQYQEEKQEESFFVTAFEPAVATGVVLPRRGSARDGVAVWGFAVNNLQADWGV